MCAFTVKVYLKSWMEASFPASAPRNDLGLLKMLYDYPDKKIATTALNKLSGHLWYLSEELVALAFFDQEVPDDMKRQMVVSLSKVGDEEPSKRPQREDCENKCLADFVTINTRQFFQKLKLDQKFLDEDPSTWKDHDAFSQLYDASKVFQSLMIVEKEVWLLFKNIISS